MPSALPSENAWSKAVKDFGIGPYDGASDDTTPKGEDDERREPEGKSLPDGGAPDDRPIEYYLGYPQEEAIEVFTAMVNSGRSFQHALQAVFLSGMSAAQEAMKP